MLRLQGHESEMPTTLLRSSGGAAEVSPKPLDSLLLSSISNIVRSLRAERHSGPTQAARASAHGAAAKAGPSAAVQSPPPPPPAAAPDDDDEDIFGDAGRDYAPGPRVKAAAGKPFSFVERPKPQPATSPPAAAKPAAPAPSVAKRKSRPVVGAGRLEQEYDFSPGAGAGYDSDDEPDAAVSKLPLGKPEKAPKKPGIGAQVADIRRVLEAAHGDKHKSAFGEGKGKEPVAEDETAAPVAKRKKLAGV